MSLQKLIHNYATFNSWANIKLADWLHTIDEVLLYEQLPSSFNGIDNTIQHILRVQKFWAVFISQKDVSNFDWSVRENQVKKNLNELKNQSVDMENLFLTYTNDKLTEEMELNMPWAKNKLSRYEYIMHVINHSTYHRGQVVTIARVLGIKENIPATDYNFFKSK